jgi:hypothetical protein
VTYEEVGGTLPVNLGTGLGSHHCYGREGEYCSMRLPLSYDLAAEMCTIYVHVYHEELSLTASGNRILAPVTKGSKGRYRYTLFHILNIIVF